MQAVAHDLAVNLQEDRPGTLAKALGALGQAQLNVEGYAEIEGVLHVLTGDPHAARRALEDAGFSVVEREVVVLDVPDRPGAAAQFFRRIADARVNVTFSYLATGPRLVIRAENPEKLAELHLGDAK